MGVTDVLQVAYVTCYDPVQVVESLPKPVFPVKMEVRCPPTRTCDTPDETFSTPEYPANIMTPETPYIPSTTVYFDNPASRPPASSKTWRQDEFVEAFAEQVEMLESERDGGNTGVEMGSLTVVEIPQAYLTTDPETGSVVAKPGLYGDKAEMTLARFTRDGTIRATKIRSEVEESIPDESRALTRLTRLVEATAKPTRYGKQTQADPGRARYYTEAESEKYNDPSLMPAVYEPNTISGDMTRPLSPFIDELGEFLPALVRRSELVTTAKLTGEERQETTFRAENIIK